MDWILCKFSWIWTFYCCLYFCVRAQFSDHTKYLQRFYAQNQRCLVWFEGKNIELSDVIAKSDVLNWERAERQKAKSIWAKRTKENATYVFMMMTTHNKTIVSCLTFDVKWRMWKYFLFFQCFVSGLDLKVWYKMDQDLAGSHH